MKKKMICLLMTTTMSLSAVPTVAMAEDGASENGVTALAEDTGETAETVGITATQDGEKLEIIEKKLTLEKNYTDVTLTAPEGTQYTWMINKSGPFGNQQTYTFSAGQAAGTYNINCHVTQGNPLLSTSQTKIYALNITVNSAFASEPTMELIGKPQILASDTLKLQVDAEVASGLANAAEIKYDWKVTKKNDVNEDIDASPGTDTGNTYTMDGSETALPAGRYTITCTVSAMQNGVQPSAAPIETKELTEYVTVINKKAALTLELQKDGSRVSAETDGEYKLKQDNDGNYTIQAKLEEMAGGPVTVNEYRWTATKDGQSADNVITATGKSPTATLASNLEAGTYVITCTPEVSEEGVIIEPGTAELKLVVEATTPPLPSLTNITEDMVTVTGDLTYNGSTQEPTVTVKKDSATLAEGTDYTVTYQKDGQIVQNPTDAGTYTVVVEGEGSYTGKVDTKTFTIQQATLTDADIEVSALTYDATEQSVSITPAKASVTPADYEVTGGTQAATNAGEYTVTITGKGNYTGTLNKKWNIAPMEIEVSGAMLAGKTYDGKSDTTCTDIAFQKSGGSVVDLQDGEYTVTSAKYNTKDASTPPAQGKVTVKLKEKGNYIFSKSQYEAEFTQGVTGSGIAKAAAPTLKKVYVVAKKGETKEIAFSEFGMPDDAGQLTFAMPAGYTPSGITIDNTDKKITISSELSGSIALSVTSDNYAEAQARIEYTFTNQGIPILTGVDGKTPITAITKTYDGTNFDINSYAEANLKAMVNGEEIAGAWYLNMSDGETSVGSLKDVKDSGTYNLIFFPTENDKYETVRPNIQITIAPKALTATAAVSPNTKAYDGTTDLADDQNLTVTFDGLVEGETLEAGTGYSAVASYDSADVGANKTITATVTLKNGNYSLATNTYTITGASIEKADLSGYDVSCDGVDAATTFKDLNISKSFTGIDNQEVTGYTLTWTDSEGTPVTDATTIQKDEVYTWTFTHGNYKDATGTITPWQDAAQMTGVTLSPAVKTVTEGYSAFTITATPTVTGGLPSEAPSYVWYLDGQADTQNSNGAAYTFAAGKAAGTYTVKCEATVNGVMKDATATITVEKGSNNNNNNNNNSGGSSNSGGGGSSKPSTKPSTSTSTDSNGTTTTTTTDKNGNTTVTETQKDGTVTETTIETDGTVTETVIEADGSVFMTETRADGTVTETVAAADGSTATATTDADGRTEAVASLSGEAVAEAQANNKPVTVPVTVTAASTSEEAPKIDISVPTTEEVRIEIPVEDVTDSTVVVLVHEDGTEEIVKTTAITENGLSIKVSGDVQVKILENKKEFSDAEGHWAQRDIDFLSGREIMSGVGEKDFGTDELMTRGMVSTVLARLDGEDTSGGKTWYQVGVDWAKEKGISDGTSPEGNVTRQQLATILYRYAGSPAVEGSLDYTDAGDVDSYAQQAMVWATQNGIMSGMGDGTLAPQDNATRGQVAAMLARYIRNFM